MAYCSDIVNLQALYGADRSAAPLAALAVARQNLVEVNAKLERLTDAMLASGGQEAPAIFVKRARELEQEKLTIQNSLAEAERDLVAAARTEITGSDEVWRRLADGVEAQDYEARLQTRQLVADTFERIVIYHRGVRPGLEGKGPMDMMLLAKGGTARLLRISRDGELIMAESLDHAKTKKSPPTP